MRDGVQWAGNQAADGAKFVGHVIESGATKTKNVWNATWTEVGNVGTHIKEGYSERKALGAGERYEKRDKDGNLQLIIEENGKTYRMVQLKSGQRMKVEVKNVNGKLIEVKADDSAHEKQLKELQEQRKKQQEALQKAKEEAAKPWYQKLGTVGKIVVVSGLALIMVLFAAAMVLCCRKGSSPSSKGHYMHADVRYE